MLDKKKYITILLRLEILNNFLKFEPLSTHFLWWGNNLYISSVKQITLLFKLEGDNIRNWLIDGQMKKLMIQRSILESSVDYFSQNASKLNLEHFRDEMKLDWKQQELDEMLLWKRPNDTESSFFTLNLVNKLKKMEERLSEIISNKKNRKDEELRFFQEEINDIVRYCLKSYLNQLISLKLEIENLDTETAENTSFKLILSEKEDLEKTELQDPVAFSQYQNRRLFRVFSSISEKISQLNNVYYNRNSVLWTIPVMLDFRQQQRSLLPYIREIQQQPLRIENNQRMDNFFFRFFFVFI